jgi:hypothetical protein
MADSTERQFGAHGAYSVTNDSTGGREVQSITALTNLTLELQSWDGSGWTSLQAFTIPAGATIVGRMVSVSITGTAWITFR